MIKLPRVKSETFLSGMLDDSRDVISISAKDKERLERKYRELRQKTRESLKMISVKWEEECVGPLFAVHSGNGADLELRYR